MAVPIIIGLAALRLIAVIAITIGGVLVTAFWRDATTQVAETTLTKAELESETINTVLDDPSLTPEQKTQLLLSLTAPTTDTEKTLAEQFMPLVVTGGIILILIQYFKSERSSG